MATGKAGVTRDSVQNVEIRMLHVRTNDPPAFIATVKKLIDAKKIKTWSYNKDGDLRYEVEQYRSQVYGLRPVAAMGSLDLQVLKLAGGPELTQAIRAIVYGRFVEEVLAHFGKADFSNVTCDPLA
jgi:hypothetical protein